MTQPFEVGTSSVSKTQGLGPASMNKSAPGERKKSNGSNAPKRKS